MGNCSEKETGYDTGTDANKHEDEPSDKISQVDTTGGIGNARAQNIHAAPIELKPSFKPPVHKKSEALVEFFKKALHENFIFSTVRAENLQMLIDAFESFKVSKGTKIITEGEVGDYFYAIEEGTVDFTVAGENVGEAGAGKSFGGLALLYDCPRSATCVAKTDCALWRVDQETFRHIQINYAAKEGLDTKALLREVPFLKDLDEDYISRLAYAVTSESFTTGETIVTKGDEGDKFYVVKTGKVVIRDIEVGGKTFADQVGEKYFGERALVKNEPRAANVIALEDTQVFTISGAVFMDVLGNLSDLIIRSNDIRRLRGMVAFSESKISDQEYSMLVNLIKDVSFPAGSTIFKEGESLPGALYIVRSGQVTVTSTSENNTKVITDGGMFGEPYIYTVESTAVGTAVVDEDCVVGTITEKEIFSVLRSRRRLHDPNGRAQSMVVKKVIKYADLKKHRLLGVGTFGKVWLVSVKNAAKPEAYALKIQRKRLLLDHKQVDGALREMTIMAQLDHPFIVKMVGAYQDNGAIMILLGLVQGGELFSLMKRSKKGRLGEDAAKFYAAGILEGLTHMHHRNILYRDLKPENVLIDADGYPVIVDLGFAKVVEDKTFTLCGTPWYIAPEVILGTGHGKGCDYWSHAVMVHEMITGITPFNDYGTDQMTLFKAIVHGKSKISRVSMHATDMIKRVLMVKPALRLGCKAGGDMDLKKHPFYKTINWDELIEKSITPPWKPQLKDALDVSDFDNWDHMDTKDRERALTSKEQTKFKGFSEVCTE